MDESLSTSSISSIPNQAYMTCKGSKVIESIVQPIPYKNKPSRAIEFSTLKEFKVTDKEFENKLFNHKVNHVS